MTLVKNTAAVSSLTLLSRIFGVIRDALIAMVIGTTAQSDAFFIAFRPFDLLRKMFSDGIFSISFVPEFSRYIAADQRDRAVSMVVSALVVLSAIGVFLVLTGLLAAPWIMQLMAPGFEPGGEKFSMTLVLFRIMMPYIWVIMMISLCMGVLNTLGNFYVPGITPLVFNLVVILFTLLVTQYVDVPVTGLALGVIFGGLVQLVFQVPLMLRHGMLGPARFVLCHPGVVSSAIKMVPCMVGAAPYQVNMLVISFLASFLADGSVSFLYYADRVVQFPVALIAVSFSTVLLPFYSRKAAAGELAEIATVFDTGIRLMVFVAIPAMAGLMILNEPIVKLLFGQGAFDALAAVQTAECLFYLAMGVWAFIGSRLFVTLHYAVGSFRHPFFAGLISIGINLLCASVLMPSMGITGLALSVSLSSVAGFVFLLCHPPAKIWFSKSDMLVSACRAIFLSAIMAFSIKWVAGFIICDSGGKLLLGAGVMACVGLGVAVVFGTARALQFPELDVVKQWSRKKSKRTDFYGHD
ncbi:MAG: murein biosynthesis integral membrane protein MurJ [Desulfotignum sp.]|nr:murein biosynthesis integral membrane protein MurJ [Desulfotignum sp.]MCF8126419.1 murein biosynthesis integral membrane protein MurJ [Desulfotignum sp.]